MPRPLGAEQTGVLRSLRRAHSWSEGCGWHWGGYANTARILESLVRRGLVTKAVENHSTVYRPVEEPRS